MRAAALMSLFVSVVLLGSACVPAEAADERDAGRIGGARRHRTRVRVCRPGPSRLCVEMVKFGTYVGDAAWTQMWSDAGENDAGVQTACNEIGLTDPVRLQQIHTEWIGVQQEIAAAQEPPPAVEPGPARYGNCEEAIAADGGNYRQGVDAQYDWYDDRDNDGVVCESG